MLLQVPFTQLGDDDEELSDAEDAQVSPTCCTKAQSNLTSLY